MPQRGLQKRIFAYSEGHRTLPFAPTFITKIFRVSREGQLPPCPKVEPRLSKPQKYTSNNVAIVTAQCIWQMRYDINTIRLHHDSKDRATNKRTSKLKRCFHIFFLFSKFSSVSRSKILLSRSSRRHSRSTGQSSPPTSKNAKSIAVDRRGGLRGIQGGR